jgi:folate-binding protein YgfZ
MSSVTTMDEPAAAQLAASALGDRGVVEVAGDDAPSFLQGLVTNDVLGLGGEARYAALLTPQGKILFDFLVVGNPTASAPRYYLDCPSALAADLVKRLSLYKLRAKVTVVDCSDTLGVIATWGASREDLGLAADDVRADYADPRREGLGRRLIVARTTFPALPGAVREAGAVYERHRIELEIPKGGVDFAYADAFPHEANFDRLHGVDFKKGCYVGQEVVSRVEHRGLARKRIVGVRFAGEAPPAGAAVTAGEVDLGIMGSSAEGMGLALLRLDRVETAVAAGTPIISGQTRLEVSSRE